MQADLQAAPTFTVIRPDLPHPVADAMASEPQSTPSPAMVIALAVFLSLSLHLTLLPVRPLGWLQHAAEPFQLARR